MKKSEIFAILFAGIVNIVGIKFIWPDWNNISGMQGPAYVLVWGVAILCAWYAAESRAKRETKDEFWGSAREDLHIGRKVRKVSEYRSEDWVYLTLEFPIGRQLSFHRIHYENLLDKEGNVLKEIPIAFTPYPHPKFLDSKGRSEKYHLYHF